MAKKTAKETIRKPTPIKEPSILDEIQHDMKQEKFEQIFTVHGKKFILGAVLILGITVAYTINKNISESKSMEIGSVFNQAFEGTEPDKYDPVIAKDQKGYTPMAILMKAALLRIKEENTLAIQELRLLSDKKDYDRAFTEIAKINEAFLLIDQKTKSEKILKILDEASKEGAVFRYTALELKAAYLYENGDRKKALEIFRELSTAEKSPATIQERARQALAVVGS